eukprot:1160271-Pelagomonas_calceolata.AAC.11
MQAAKRLPTLNKEWRTPRAEAARIPFTKRRKKRIRPIGIRKITKNKRINRPFASQSGCDKPMMGHDIKLFSKTGTVRPKF